MRHVLLKYQLISLFIATAASMVAFLFRNSLPDNSFAISSDTYLNFFTYYPTSALMFIDYFTGPWLLLPFIIFACLYAFLFSQRDYKWDLFNFIPLLGAFLFLAWLVDPRMIGAGIRYYLQGGVQPWLAWVLLIVLTCLTIWGCFRSSFKMTVGLFGRSVNEFIYRFVVSMRNIKEKISSIKFNRIKLNLFHKASAKLKSDSYFAEEKEMIQMSNSPRKVEAENYSQLGESTLVQETLDLTSKESGFEKQQVKKTSLPKSRIKSEELISYLGVAKGRKSDNEPEEKYFKDIIMRIEEKLQEFKVDGKIINILKGPVVDTFELELGTGVKVSKVNSITEDLGLALYGAPIRLVYPLIGRTTMGIEVPRNPRDIIFLDEVFQSKEFRQSNMKLPVAMGKNSYGKDTVVDLASMPHMLIAGATGAGKSVFINTLLISLLVKKSPEELKLILIDPKQLELALYANIPHLSLPVITDAKLASHALMWASEEMERRYSILREAGVRDLDRYNQKVEILSGEKLEKISSYFADEASDTLHLPYIVIVIDEFADLILNKAGKEIENNVCRLAAKARACGIHIVLATQRPSVNVVTGLIKSNFPNRVSFRVTSVADSRTILDSQGAEKLLGKGDMLHKYGTEVKRCHSAYIDEKEVELLMEKLAEIPGEFNARAMEFVENEKEMEMDEYTYIPNGKFSDAEGGSRDAELFNQALRIVCESRQASASMLQRRLRIGYNRAALLIEQMEERGIVGPQQGSKPREVLTTGP